MHFKTRAPVTNAAYQYTRRRADREGRGCTSLAFQSTAILPFCFSSLPKGSLRCFGWIMDVPRLSFTTLPAFSCGGPCPSPGKRWKSSRTTSLQVSFCSKGDRNCAVSCLHERKEETLCRICPARKHARMHCHVLEGATQGEGLANKHEHDPARSKDTACALSKILSSQAFVRIVESTSCSRTSKVTRTRFSCTRIWKAERAMIKPNALCRTHIADAINS